jgi:hypothetical protein
MTASELTLPRLLHKKNNAVVSGDGVYRYWLHRQFESGDGWAVFVMLNPSTADAEKDDATIRSCMGLAKRWGCEGIAVVNLFAYRATAPADLEFAQRRGLDVEGPENHAYVCLAVDLASQSNLLTGKNNSKLICAWGASRTALGQVPTMMGWLDHSMITPKSLGLPTKSGMPRHPLYTPFSTALIPYDYIRGERK